MTDTQDILAMIANGILDDDLRTIQLAVTERQKKRQEDLMAQVHEVFGENAEITIKR